MKMNPATGLPVYKYAWEDKLSEREKAGVEMWRKSGLPKDALVSRLVNMLDKMEATQGGQLALQEDV